MNIAKALKKVSKNIQNKLSLNPQVDHDPPHSVVHDHPRHFLEHTPPNEARSSVVPTARHVGEASSSVVPPQNDGDCLFKPVVFSLSKKSAAGGTGSEFHSELEASKLVRHHNLLSLVGYCLGEGEKILVYEYMPNGTLSQHLFDWEVEGLQSLTWNQRMIIALDIAKGLEYLHGSLTKSTIVHGDLKPSNILLGENMRAKIADFGLGCFIPHNKSSIRTGNARGTFGYIAPEYAGSGTVAPPGDVYSFGVMLMELMTGSKAVDDSRGEDRRSIVTWFQEMRKDENLLISAVDETIDTTEEDTLATIGIIRKLAFKCTERSSGRRPDMSRVVSVLYPLVEN
ncbi:receptor protein kinase TMK1 [Medicago truncatula]|uniref:Tyrosine kinase family protein n=1 Tax=Medicago truncatula TaxID=3880 RepID=G7KBN2_MEDTR|nr:receptor protein kinase TMK1 [Medicago truncatula]AES99335.2 tyrosine kinase family protein [Medicago truncatula]